ncbi:hypothetical protein C5167_011278 [Papaver somniferum]|uniref:Uncharacterized protein n=1 Tax=Papaver somniferum TaxID=3469 RepID=A0A4Y7K5F5_PAPSO|nr:hypothetical protein C5167_011278 [Papaver somniferum]
MQQEHHRVQGLNIRASNSERSKDKSFMAYGCDIGKKNKRRRGIYFISDAEEIQGKTRSAYRKLGCKCLFLSIFVSNGAKRYAVRCNTKP